MAGETKKSIKDLVKGPNPSPFATFAASLLSNDWDTVEAKLADNIEWNMMPNNQILKGKKDVINLIRNQHIRCG